MPLTWEEATAQVRAKGCDFEGVPSLYMDRDGTYVCRCMICFRCKRHTGNSTQGHFWQVCHVRIKFHSQHKKDSVLDCEECHPDFHQCCPNDCELFEQDGTVKDKK